MTVVRSIDSYVDDRVGVVVIYIYIILYTCAGRNVAAVVQHIGRFQ